MGLFSWSHIWIYLLANLAGGVAAAYAFRLTEPWEALAVERRLAPDAVRDRPQPGSSFTTPRTQ
jgi:aquaporin Z